MNTIIVTGGLHLRRICSQRVGVLHLVDVGPLELQQGLTLVAGQNDGGKSSWLSAIALLLETKELDAADRSNGIGSDQLVEVEGVFAHVEGNDGQEDINLRVRYENSKPIKEQMISLPVGMTVAPEGQTVDQLKESIRRLFEILETIPAEQYEIVWVDPDSTILRKLPRLQLFSSSTATDPEATVRAWTRGQVKTILADKRFENTFTEIEEEMQAKVYPNFTRFSDYIKKHSDDLDGVNIKLEIDFQSVSPLSTIEFVRQGNAVDISRTGEGRLRKTTLEIPRPILTC